MSEKISVTDVPHEYFSNEFDFLTFRFLFLATWQYPAVRDNVQGEENATFTNALGETVELSLNDSKENTINLLVKILNGDNDAAVALADEVHRDVLCTDADIENIPDLVIFDFFFSFI